ncbi:hypothetical protein G9A89_002215 [Geosiphon pyriformis]|nr:hypothetical protein G9A89_002215 [Geosiphon pyriformis]
MSFQQQQPLPVSIGSLSLGDQQLEQKTGPQQSIKAFLYLAVISVFMRASMATAGPYQTLSQSGYISSYEQSVLRNEHTNSLIAQGLSSFSHDERVMKNYDHSLNAGVFGVILTGTAALLNGWA